MPDAACTPYPAYKVMHILQGNVGLISVAHQAILLLSSL
ncbi:hypothetical protein AB15_2192 [Escherichia coli 3-020-07_S1_C1]|nr:hypothetical protein AB15_2192 [Escherichia coli 3-020-07_S1_C1]